jgi:hypothetical protein
MTERAIRWEPVRDIVTGFGAISFVHEYSTLLVTMHGTRNLTIRFSGLIGLRFEEECPGFDPLPRDLPMLEPRLTFPLVRIENSHWLEQFHHIHKGRAHFALISHSHLVQLLAKPNAEAHWQ